MTEVKQKSISLLFQSGAGVSYILVVSTDFENGFARTIKAKGEEKRASEKESFEESFTADEISQTEKQILINTIRQQRNEKEQERFEKELEWDEEEYEFLCDKFTNKDLHEWLVKQMTKLSKTMCKLTTKVAKMAEKCYHFEIGDTDMGNAKTFISNSYWDGAYSGLLSADRLIADLHAMEVAYLENDGNEVEITRPISLKEIKDENQQSIFDKIKIGEECFLEIKSSQILKNFNLTFCRIRDVRIQVAAPSYEGVFLDVSLTLESNTLKYKTNEIINRLGVRTIATSTAHSNCGNFAFEFKADKYLPFEGAGFDSKWRITISESDGLLKDDLSDVILFITYTARSN